MINGTNLVNNSIKNEAGKYKEILYFSNIHKLIIID